MKCLKTAFFLLCLYSTFVFAQTPTTWRTTLDSVSIRLLLRDTAFAEVMMNRIVTSVPDSAEAWYSRAVFYGQLRRWEDVARDGEKALSLQERLEYYLLVSEAYQTQKKMQAAVKVLGKAIAAYPKHELPFYFRGVLTMQLGDAENAIWDFSDAITLNPTFPEAYLKRGMAYISAKRPVDAVQDFDSCIVLDPMRADAYFLRGSVRIDEGNKKRAAEDLIKAAELGYRTATDLLRGYCADVVPKSKIDSLQNYTLQEVNIEAERDIIVAAKQDIKSLAKRAPSIIRGMIARLGTNGLQRSRATFGGGSGIVVGARDLNAPVTAAALENKVSSQITLAEIVSYLRDRVTLLGNEKAQKILREIQNLQQSVALSSQDNTRDNAVFIRENLQLIGARIQELEKVLEQTEAEKNKSANATTPSKQ